MKSNENGNEQLFLHILSDASVCHNYFSIQFQNLIK